MLAGSQYKNSRLYGSNDCLFKLCTKNTDIIVNAGPLATISLILVFLFSQNTIKINDGTA